MSIVLSQIEGIATYLIVASIALVLLIIIFAIILKVRSKKNINKKAGKVNIIDGVRYSKEDNIINHTGNIQVSHAKKDIILSRGKTYKVEKDGFVIPGQYTVLSCDESTFAFNMRIAGFVREFKHGDRLVIGEGDEVTAISHSVILR